MRCSGLPFSDVSSRSRLMLCKRSRTISSVITASASSSRSAPTRRNNQATIKTINASAALITMSKLSINQEEVELEPLLELATREPVSLSDEVLAAPLDEAAGSFDDAAEEAVADSF